MNEKKLIAQEKFDDLKREQAKIINEQLCEITEQAKELAQLRAQIAQLQSQRQGQAEIDMLRGRLNIYHSAVDERTDKRTVRGKGENYEADIKALVSIITDLRFRISTQEQALQASRERARSCDALIKRLQMELKGYQAIAARPSAHAVKLEGRSKSGAKVYNNDIKQHFIDPLTEIIGLVEHFSLENDLPDSWDAVSLQLLEMVDGREPIIGKLAVAFAFMGFALDKARNDISNDKLKNPVTEDSG